MPKPHIRALKWIGAVPVVGACSSCGRQFTVPLTAIKRVADAQQNLTVQFEGHNCSVQTRDDQIVNSTKQEGT